ncbi:MAG: UDP-3-O-[3-hydroxymyristoyl] glucosamine N-acyltransferase [Rhodospirillales bacterium]|nr:UDP-3-O-[3-hydroxymyristoyl] glucosamine N-acyltransferase [Rhodospirillales bacterium]
MIDPRFFANAGPFTLGDLADRLGGSLADDAPRDFAITDLAMLDEAHASEIALFADSRYRAAFAATKAGVVITRPDLMRNGPVTGGPHLIHVPMPRQALAEIAWLFYPLVEEALGLTDEREAAIIGEGCRIATSAIVGKGVQIGARTLIGANAVIGNGVVIGADCKIGPNTTISQSIIGDRVHIYSGAVVGAQGFGFVPGARGLRRVPQLGRVLIGNDVEFGANSTADRGALGDTVIGDGTVIDNQIQIGHNCRIGRHCILCGQTGIAGSVTIEDGAVIGGASRIADHVTIGAGAKLAGGSGVTRDIGPGEVVAGYPAIPVRDWHRQAAGLEKLFSRPRKRPD